MPGVTGRGTGAREPRSASGRSALAAAGQGCHLPASLLKPALTGGGQGLALGKMRFLRSVIQRQVSGVRRGFGPAILRTHPTPPHPGLL